LIKLEEKTSIGGLFHDRCGH